MAYDRGNYQHKWRIERIATRVREELGADQVTPLDPWHIAEAIPAHVFYPEDFGDEVLALKLRQAKWDGFAFCCPGEATLMVLLNAARSKRRQAATLMEELAHHLLGHQPSSIGRDNATGLTKRTYNASQENEAYDLGTAILLPKERVQQDVAAKRTASEIADAHGCSEELVIYRIKRMRLYQRYQGYAA